MTNIVKKGVIKSRDRVLGNVMYSIQKLSNKLDFFIGEQEKTNEKHQQQNNELTDTIKNSGTIRISDKELLTKTFSGLKIYLDPRDISVTPHLALDSIWEYHITRAWLSVVGRNDVVMDIGANFGYFGALAAQVTERKNSKVIFFEANPQLIPYISKTLSVNWLNEQSVVENLAVADSERKVTLNILKDYIGSSSLHSVDHIDGYMHNKMHIVETETTVSVQATTIDAYCRKNKIGAVDLIKMDIEGFEDKAYDGMRKTIKASPNATLFIEFTKESYENPKQFYDNMLEDFGYVYLIDAQGKLTLQKRTDYESVIGNPDDWIMPVFSKNSKLATS